MSAVPEVEVETRKTDCTDTITSTDSTTTTTTTTTTATTTTTTTTTIATTVITTPAVTTTTISDMKEQKKYTAENSVLPCIKTEDPENGQFHSDFVMNSATVPIAERLSSAATEEKKDLVQSSNSDIVTEDNVIADNENIDRPEVDAVLTFETENTAVGVAANVQNSANSSNQNKADCNISSSAVHNLKIASDQSLKPEVITPIDSALSESQINATAAIAEQSDAAFILSSGEKEENDLKDERIRGTDEGTETEINDSEGDYKRKERSTSLDDKEASSDEADHFVDAKSSDQIDSALGDDAVEIGKETKEQTEEIQDEEGYESDEEEQEAEPDDDEVEGNPAFIPKSGRYYMHDSRITDEERTSEPSSHSRADGKWKHDRFDERSQRPKTKRELMNRYGYDIRNEGKNTGGGNTSNASTPHFNQTRGTSRGGSNSGNNYGNRGRHSNRALSHYPQHQPDDRRDRRRPMQNNGAARPTNRGDRKSEHHISINHQRDQHGTGGFKNSPMNTQKGAINHRTYHRSEEYLRDNRQHSGGNRGRGGGTAVSGGDASTTHGKGGGAHTGGKRYSTQRLTTNYTSNVQQPTPPQPPPPLQPTPTTGPISIPPPDWRPSAYQGPPPPSTVPPPPPIAIPAPVPNFRPSDIVYFDPKPQQLFRTNPIPPRTKKRLEIVPPYQAKNSN
ncbi:unnamed protein product [Cercopithifilaria johnstoni]|uniref:Protein CASC3 n=1 Tax=Cercopithifilaria johnstoni TaxID=2874296 RepID=A0A8J2ME63_9BILA|nr:unnamed protein product [Cercopithifilaria johnstoni]